MRPSWDEYFLAQLPTLALRATCDRGRAACLFVSANHDPLAAGYVGSPPGEPHCDDVGHLWSESEPIGRRHCVRTLHAEVNAVVRAARNGVRLAGSTVYCTLEPCYSCAAMLVGLEVVRVVAAHPYHAAQRTRDLLMRARVSLTVTSDEELYVP